MERVVPDYYQDFHCIGGQCKHNCCIGWEVDIDEETLAFYDAVGGEMGERLAACIDREETPHFRLDDRERCPFLNGENLCDIIAAFSDEGLCDICAAHPRFCNESGDRVEIGLGLCCEEAGRLILGRSDAVTFVGPPADDPLGRLRDTAIGVAQDRSLPLPERADALLQLCHVTVPTNTTAQWAEVFLSLERLDETWTLLLEDLRNAPEPTGSKDLLAARSTEYEQLLVYFLYRHFPSMGQRAAGFAVIGTRIIYELGRRHRALRGSFVLDDQVELARLFSSEVEYSGENLAAVQAMVTAANDQ